MVSEASKYKVLLILSLVNNYQDFGGRSQYMNWAKNAGVQINSDDDFYTNQVVKGYYKNHVQVTLKISKISYINEQIVPTFKELINDSCSTAESANKNQHNNWNCL